MSTVSDYFGSLVFDDRAMKASLPSSVYFSLKKTIDEGTNLDTEVANAVASAMKDWAVAHGATPPKSTIASSLPLPTAALSWSFPARS